jgi:hypothetical protein
LKVLVVEHHAERRVNYNVTALINQTVFFGR